MAAELEKLRQDVRNLAGKFKDAGQADLAAILDVDAQSFGAKAKIAKLRGCITFAQDSHARPQEDIFTALRLTPEQVAEHPDQITEDTKAYVGSLVHYDDQGKIIPIFQRLQGVEIYASPERKIQRQILKIDGRLESADQALAELKQAGINQIDYSEDMVKKVTFTKNPRTVELVWLNGYDVGLTAVTTTANRFERGEALGLEKCHEEVGIYQGFADKDQPLNTWYYMAMDTLTDRSGFPRVFGLARGEDGLWLRGRWAGPGDGWYPESQLVFALPQVKA